MPRRVLLLRPDNLGDVLLTQPALALLADGLPEAELTYLVGPWSRDVAVRGPLPPEHVRTLVFPGFTRRPKANAVEPYALLRAEAARLAAEEFDAAIVFRPDHWWGALLAVTAGIPIRIGFGVQPMPPLLTHMLPAHAARQHATAQALAVARFAIDTLGGASTIEPPRPTFAITPAERAAAEAFWQANGLANTQTVAIHPNAGAPLKSWPPERWAALADSLAEDGTRIVLSGGPGERAALEEIAGFMAVAPSALLVDRSLGDVAAIFERSALVVGPDSGALHLAAALDTPTVRLYGPAPADVFGPDPLAPHQVVLQDDHLPCVPCGYLDHPPCGAERLPPCMMALTVDGVLTKCRTALRARS